MDRHDVDTVLPQRLQHRLNLAGKHRDVAGDGGIVIRADECRPRIQPHPSVDRRAHLRQLEIVAADRNLVDSTVRLALMAGDLRHLRRIDCGRGRDGRRGGGEQAAALADQIDGRLELPRQFRRRAMSVHVHVEDARLVPEEVVVQRGHFQTVVEQRGHHGINLFLREDQIARHHVHARALGHLRTV